MSNIGDMLVDVKGLKSVHDSIKNTFSTKQELTNVDNKFSEVNSARQSGNGTTYDNLKARLDADKEAAEKDISELKADLGDKVNLETLDKTNIVSAINSLNGIVRIIANRDTSWAGIKENVKSGYGKFFILSVRISRCRVRREHPIMTLFLQLSITE